MQNDIDLRAGDCLATIRSLPADSFDSCVTDPPYHLTSVVKRFGAPGAAPAQHGTDRLYARASAGFMGKQWDGGDIAFRPETWAEVWRVLKPGAHLIAFGAPRGYHRMACAIEDAGFEIRDSLMWLFGTGFPKSHAVDNGIAAKFNPEREPGDPLPSEAARWQGWGTALKPAYEPIVLARKPLSGTVAETVLAHGTGALNIDATRIPTDPALDDPRLGGKGQWGTGKMAKNVYEGGYAGTVVSSSPLGRWPANIVHDGSDEALAAFPASSTTGVRKVPERKQQAAVNTPFKRGKKAPEYTDSGSAARFFYSAKAGKADRAGSKHPTVKPVALMRWLCRLVTPPGGLILDPFAGSGTTGQAAREEGFRAVLCEREEEYLADIRRRLGLDPPADDALAAYLKAIGAAA